MLVAHLGRLLELQRLGVRHHLRLQLVDHLLLIHRAGSARHCVHVARVVGLRDQPDAGPRAALDLVQQAGPRAVGEDRVLAGAQAEDLLHQLDRLLDGPRIGVGAEVAVLAVHRAAEVAHARKTLGLRGALVRGPNSRDLQVGVALVVAEQDVELGVQRLDQVVLEQQRLGLGAHHRGLQPRDARNHVADARATVVLVQVAGDPLLQVARLAHVQHAALRIEVAVDAGQAGQRGHLGRAAARATWARRAHAAARFSVRRCSVIGVDFHRLR